MRGVTNWREKEEGGKGRGAWPGRRGRRVTGTGLRGPGSGETGTSLRGPGGRTPKSCSRKGFLEHDFRVALRVRVAPLGASSCFSGPSWGSFGRQFWAVGGSPGLSWRVQGVVAPSWGLPRPYGEPLVAALALSWPPFGALVSRLSSLWGPLGTLLGASWAVLARYWGPFWPSGAL